MIDSVFKTYANDEVSLAQAREAIAHVVTAEHNEGEVRRWLEPERVAVWKEFCRATRPGREAWVSIIRETAASSTTWNTVLPAPLARINGRRSPTEPGS
jgi:endonuclease/exonuclease/phosphatase (EEP) superfamily protein YafD